MIYSIIITLLFLLSLGYSIFITLIIKKFVNIITKMETSIEEALDKINVDYSYVADLLNTYLASEDPVVRAIHFRLKSILNTILEVANILSNASENKTDDESDDE